MRVKELQTAHVKSCSGDTDLAAAAKIMWDCDCGVVPVIDHERKVIGVITDRDICIATATRATVPSEIRVRDVMSGQDLHSCGPDDDVRTALATMKRHRVRRLPVLDQQQRLVGIISVNDLVRRADGRKGADVPGEEFLETLQAICAHSAEAVSA
jgi:CBS domain-containing protein